VRPREARRRACSPSASWWADRRPRRKERRRAGEAVRLPNDPSLNLPVADRALAAPRASENRSFRAEHARERAAKLMGKLWPVMAAIAVLRLLAMVFGLDGGR
jgi:hypothetical protein